MAQKPSVASRILEKQLGKKPARPAAKPQAPVAQHPDVDEPQIAFSCGHSRPVRCIARAVCPECRDKAIQAAAEKRRGGTKAECKQLARASKYGRLPNGSRFAVAFDAEKTLWSGTLTLACGQVFCGEAGAVFRLMRQLDKDYRKWAKGRNPVEEKPAASE